ncbi:MAG TPA: tripartite tricarboxylate transporter substrate binding protein [Burkholderiales bacterium]|nr:tripartite tricarboxylate transporter substrate binding protein [Burkholderiales bacterium]
MSETRQPVTAGRGSRRAFALAFVIACATSTAYAAERVSVRAGPASYPTKPLRLLVPFTPGGSQDVTARLLSAPVQQSLGENVVVDNRPGSGGLIATQEAARATPDGYTLLLSSGAQMAIQPALHAKPGYDPVKSFVHVIHLTDTPLALVVHPGVPVASVKEFIAYTHANKGRVNVASTGNATYTHLTLELFKAVTGADVTHIPYKGAAPAINDVISKQIHGLFTSTASAQPHTASGRLKAIAVTSTKRSAAMPDTPTFAEAGMKGLDVSVWIGISAPAGVRPPIVDRLAREYGQALKTPEVRERLLKLGAEPNGETGAAFARMVREDVARWARIVKNAGVRIE